jgi:FKBP-type peptidyl-prolyl cis-trans isomerase (trigger factor)
VFRTENLKVEGSDLQVELERMAMEHRMSPKDMMETLEKVGAMDELSNRAVSSKVRRFLAEKAGLMEPAGAGA